MAGDVREQLAEGLEGDARRARLALVDELRDQGWSDEELLAARTADRLALLPLERLLSAEGDRTVAEIAAEYDVAVDDLIATRRALGLPIDPDRPVYGEALERHAARLSSAVQSGVPVALLIELNRVIGRSMAAIAGGGAETIARVMGQYDSGDEHFRATGLATAVEQFMPMLGDVLDYAYQEHVREVVRNARADALTLSAEDANVRQVAVAFADLVGFTSLGSKLSPTGISRIAGRLEELAGDALQPGVSIVKTIGDEVMLASEDADALTGTVLTLTAAADAAGDDFPRLRAGAAYGPAVRRSADWYGAPVNLASRLTSLGDPGTLLADEAFASAARDSAAWEAAGEREVRGVAGAVATFRAAPGDPATGSRPSA